MKAAVYHGKEQLIVQDVPEPSLNEGEVLVEIDACSVCGTDMRTYKFGEKKLEMKKLLE